jgi:ribosomal RNA methyltransferase Nop2
LVIDWLLETFEDLKLVDTGLEVGDEGLTTVFGKELNAEISKTRRLWPHKTGTEGFFIAKLMKAQK